MLVTNTLAYWAHSLVMKKHKCFLYVTPADDLFLLMEQNTFLPTYECVQKARVLYYTGLERLPGHKHSSLLGPFISYEGK